MGALSEMLGVDRRQVTDSASDCHAVSPYDGAGAPHYAGFNTCLEFFRTHDLLDSSNYFLSGNKKTQIF